jgi:hypothetical protein
MRGFGRKALLFIAGAAAGNYVVAGLAYGVGLIVAVIVGALSGFPVVYAALLVVGVFLVASAIALLLARLLLPEDWLFARAAAVPESRSTSERKRWRARAEVSGDNSIMFDLKSLIGTQLVRGFACDVRTPNGGVPVRATSDHSGPSTRVWFTFPDQFGGMMSVVPGRYESTWYEADEDWSWIKVARAEVDVPKSEASTRAFQ